LEKNGHPLHENDFWLMPIAHVPRQALRRIPLKKTSENSRPNLLAAASSWFCFSLSASKYI
jgi:hypothetical protein